MVRPTKKLDVDKIIRLYESGWTFAQLGRRFKVSPATIGARLHEANIPVKVHNPPRPEHKFTKYTRKIIKLYTKDGLPMCRIAEIIGCSPSTVKLTLRNNNIDIRSFNKYKLTCQTCTQLFIAYKPYKKNCALCDRKKFKRVQHRRYRDEVYARDNYTCLYCGCKEELTLDHVIPDGPDTPDNLVTCCIKCNSSKWEYPLDVFLERKFIKKEAQSIKTRLCKQLRLSTR
jgi:intein-encoded DNA endonuclease-like protein